MWLSPFRSEPERANAMVQKFTNDFIKKNFTATVVIFLGFVFGWIALMRTNGQDSIIETIIQAIIAVVVVRATYRTYQLRKHFPAIKLLRQLGDKNSPHEPATKSVIESYLSGVPGYSPKTRPYDRVIKMTEECFDTRDIAEKYIIEYCEKALNAFNDSEIRHLMTYFYKMNFENKKASLNDSYTSRETIRRNKVAKLIGEKFSERMASIQGTMPVIPAQPDNPKKSKINDLSSFELAISYIRGSKLPVDITTRAAQMRDRYQQIKEAGGFDLAIQAVATEMLDKDLPALVKDYDNLISVAAGTQKLEGKQVFINAFADIANRFDGLVKIHAQTAVDAITTRANYIRNVHGNDRDDPFALISSTQEDELAEDLEQYCGENPNTNLESYERKIYRKYPRTK